MLTKTLGLSQFNCSNYPYDSILWGNKTHPDKNKINTLYNILHWAYIQQLLPIFFVSSVFLFLRLLSVQLLLRRFLSCLWWDGKWEPIAYCTMESLSLKTKILQNRFKSFQGNHVNDPSSLCQHKGRGTISCYLPFPLLGQIHIPKCHHTSASPTGSLLLLPSLSVLSLITESGKPFSLPSIKSLLLHS